MSVQLGRFGAKETARARVLGPYGGRYSLGYELKVYREGDPKKQLKASELDLQSVIAITTNKNINQIEGSFQITLKDGRALYALHPMDVIVIRLQGHTQPLTTVLRGLVSSVGPSGSSDTEGGEESTVIAGACMGKYLQVNMFFLPVWEPKSNLPTLLVYGLGGIYQHAVTPREVIRSVFRQYVVGVQNMPGLSGTPAAAHWMNPRKRVRKIEDGQGSVFRIPYIQFNEESTEALLTRLEITGFTEAWVDEIGNIVYRRPAWDQGVSWVLPAEELLDWEVWTSDEALSTYIEVVPTGNAGVETAMAEALLAGRAPVPSSYPAALKKGYKKEKLSGAMQVFGGAFVIDVYTKEDEEQNHSHHAGEVTPKGAQNYYYKLMRRYGMRPLQIASPLLTTGKQAQEQAQGLLRFFLRKTKTAKLTIPGEPQIRLGENALLRGSLRGQRIERAFFIEGVSQEYVEEEEGGHYQTTLELAHGRDPHEPKFPPIYLEKLSPTEEKNLDENLVKSSKEKGESAVSYGSAHAKLLSGNKATRPGEAPEAVQLCIEGGNEIVGKEYVYGGSHGMPLAGLNPSKATFDCSSAVSYILWKGGFLSEGYARTSGELEDMYEAGTGKEITIYANSFHVFIVVAGVMFDTFNPGTGKDELGWYAGTAANIAANLGTFAQRHPKGF